MGEGVLLFELHRIKMEREEEMRRKTKEEAREREAVRWQEVLQGNVLRNVASEKNDKLHRVKRRWDVDVVFKNQGYTDPIVERRFINDTVRSDFHKRFMERYIK